MILLSELSRRRIRSVQKLIRVGRNEVVVVLRVDKEKGHSGVILFNRYIAVLSHTQLHKGTLISQSDVYHRKISSNAKNVT